MAQRRSITSHPAFAPLLAIWFAALFGLALAVLPAASLQRALGAAGLGSVLPLTSMGRLAALAAAALAGALLGLALGVLLARRAVRDPRPTYFEAEVPFDHPASDEPSRRRPLHIREELGEAGHDEDMTFAAEMPRQAPPEGPEQPEPQFPAQSVALANAEAGEGFMILTAQPIHPPRPAPDLEALLEQFDTALAAFRSTDDDHPPSGSGRADPVHAFVARQTGTPAPSALGGIMPNHQNELRAALDKLARAHRSD